jgi:uncharacterized delta-60 repeat protein
MEHYCFFILGFVKAQTGTIDFSFNPGTGFKDAVQSVVMQLDGKIIISGWFTSFDGAVTNRIARLNSDGSLDTSFNIGSGFNGQVNSTPIQADGKIIVGGNFTSFNGVSRNRIARLNNDGTLDELYQQIETNITNSQVQDRLDAILNPLGQFHIDS